MYIFKHVNKLHVAHELGSVNIFDSYMVYFPKLNSSQFWLSARTKRVRGADGVQEMLMIICSTNI